LLQIAIYLVHI